jgi:hypothetical protein
MIVTSVGEERHMLIERARAKSPLIKWIRKYRVLRVVKYITL